jgi:hypothetical protein
MEPERHSEQQTIQQHVPEHTLMQVKGTAFNARLAFIKSKFGEDKLGAVWERAPQVQALVSSSGDFYPSRLYDYSHYTAFNQAVADAFYGGRETAFIEMGRDSADGALQSVHKIFVMNRDVRSFLRSLPVLYNAYYVDMGAAEVALNDRENTVTITVKMPRTPHRSLCQILRGYVLRGMELCGANSIADTETSCMARGGEACVMVITWN